MAPSIIATSDSNVGNSALSHKPTVYVMDAFDPAAITRAQELFHVVLPNDSQHKNWQSGQYLLIRASYLTRDQIATCPNLRAIGKQGVGTDKIDAAACAARGIKVLNTPGVNARAVAELVLALTMSVARQIRTISVRIAEGEVVRKESCSGLIMNKCTIGILGMGNIGRTVANIFRGAFESSIVTYDPYLAEGAWSDIPHKRVKTVDEVLKASDVLTIHIPLTAETRGLITYAKLATMKRNAILINTARGGIVDEEGLRQALDDGLIWGAGLDCHEQEPPTKDKYELLWRHPNVVSTPHIGAATAQTQMETACAAVERLYEYVKLSGISPVA
jgi:phosphoglycerate dehydrogenase-like enzyme